jgi:aminoglycoside phosphotransferase (APT) family kinase protein
LGGPVCVRGLTRRPSPFAGVFPAEVVCARLGGGRQLSLFVKHLGPEQADHPEKQCRDREPRVYEELLGDEGLPVPRYYGCYRNEATGRHEVFLEHVADWDLRYQGLEHWFTAARELARLHAHFAARAGDLASCDFLLRLGAGQLRSWAERAVAVLGEQSAALAAELATVADGYGRVCEVLGRQPLTLVHNDLAPKNVLADRSRRPARVCFVDWEMAGVGCGLTDLIDLKYGLGPADDREMCRVYCDELAGTGLLPADPAERDRLFAACELHRTVYRLAFSRAWRVPPERVAQWVGEARELAGRV